MATQRMIAFETSSDEGAQPVRQALAAAFDASAHESARALPRVIGACVPGGYPRPEVVEQVGSYDLPRPVDDAGPTPRVR